MSAGIFGEQGNDFKYFLPRMLEILLESDDQTSDFFTFAWKEIAEGERQLSDAEKKALMQFAQAYYDKAKQTGNPEKVEWALGDLEEAGLKVV